MEPGGVQLLGHGSVRVCGIQSDPFVRGTVRCNPAEPVGHHHHRVEHVVRLPALQRFIPLAASARFRARGRRNRHL